MLNVRDLKFKKINDPVKGVPLAFAKQNMLEGFQPQEKKKKTKDISVTKTTNSLKLLDAYGDILKTFQKIDKRTGFYSYAYSFQMDNSDESETITEIDALYNRCCEKVASLNASEIDISKFVAYTSIFANENCFEHTLGLFLSAAMNESSEDNFSLNLLSLKSKPIHLVAYRNICNVKIFGNIGSNAVNKMEFGHVEITGDIDENFASQMLSGEIIVKGKCKDICGDAYGGTVRISGKFTIKNVDTLGSEVNIFKGRKKIVVDGIVVDPKTIGYDVSNFW